MAIEFKVVNTPRHETGGMTQALLRETKASVVKKPVKVVNSEK